MPVHPQCGLQQSQKREVQPWLPARAGQLCVLSLLAPPVPLPWFVLPPAPPLPELVLPPVPPLATVWFRRVEEADASVGPEPRA